MMDESAQQNHHDTAMGGHNSVLTNIPFTSNPAYASRRALLESIRDQLLDKQRLAIIGAPSRAKTQCQTEYAVELAHLCHEHFDRICWISGGCVAGLAGAFAEIAFALDLPEKESGQQNAMIAAVQERLGQDARCLFIFDNVAAPEAVDALIPENSNAAVLMTSYQDKWPQPERAFTIPDMRPEETKAFLEARLDRTMNAVDEECAFQLGGVPLLLHLYAGCARMAPSKEEDLRTALVQLAERQGAGKPANAEASLDCLLKRLVAALRESEKLAANLFSLASFMGPQPIYASTLLGGITYLPQSLSQGLNEQHTLAQVLPVMASAGLARIGDGAFAIPAMVQERFVSMLPHDKKESWCNAAIGFLANVFPFKEEHNQFDLQCAHLLGHASTAASWAENIGCSLEGAGRLLNQAGLYLRACGQGEEAIKYYLHAIACGEMIDGADHPKVAVRINNLGVVYRESGRLDDARDAFRKAIRIIKNAYGPADHMLAMAMRNLVTVAEDSKDEEEMERAYRRALRIYADSLGQTHPYVHECLYSLGRILRKRGETKDAQRCFEEALRCALACAPPDEEAIALYSRNLGRSLLRAGKAAEAQEHLQTAVALQRKQGLPASGALTESLYQLGNAYRIGKQFPEARKCIEEALRLCREATTPHCQLEVRILTQLARVLRAQGDNQGAATCYRQICHIQEETGGPENPDLIASLTEYGKALELSNNLADAQECFVRALNLGKNLDLEESNIGTIHYHLGMIRRATGESEKALEDFMAAVSADTRKQGKRHPDVARDLLGIGLAYRDKGDTSRAIGNIMKSLSIYEETLGKYHAQTIEARNTLEALGDMEAGA